MNQLNQNLKDLANHLPSWQLNDRQICDLELILNGAFNPLDGFLDKKSYDNVLKEMRLTDGSLWPIPITLDVSSKFLSTINNAEKIALRNKEGFIMAILTIDDIWKPDFEEESMSVLGQQIKNILALITYTIQAIKTILVEALKKYQILCIMTTNLYAITLIK